MTAPRRGLAASVAALALTGGILLANPASAQERDPIDQTLARTIALPSEFLAEISIAFIPH